jgi:hypothetical protein
MTDLSQRTALICRHFFIDERLTDDQIKEAGERFEDGFKQAQELMDVELVPHTWVAQTSTSTLPSRS